MVLSDEQIKRILEVEYIKDAVYKHDQVLVFAYGHDGKFTHVSKSVTRAFGYTKEEMINEPFIEKVYKDDIAKTNDIYAFFNSTGLPGYNHFINRYVSKLGKVLNIFWLRPVEVKGTGLWANTAIIVENYSESLNSYADGYNPFK